MEQYLEEIQILKDHGYNPLKATTMTGESTFQFSTKDEARRAYQELEIKKKLLQGWFYGEDFNDAVEEYEAQMSDIYPDFKLKIYDI
jgi:hypothetical protein